MTGHCRFLCPVFPEPLPIPLSLSRRRWYRLERFQGVQILVTRSSVPRILKVSISLSKRRREAWERPPNSTEPRGRGVPRERTPRKLSKMVSHPGAKRFSFCFLLNKLRQIVLAASCSSSCESLDLTEIRCGIFPGRLQATN